MLKILFNAALKKCGFNVENFKIFARHSGNPTGFPLCFALFVLLQF
jgi:hypothetical protein